MGIGGRFQSAAYSSDTELVMAYTGRMYITETGWNRCKKEEWILDCLNSGRQRQKIAGGPAFERPSGVAALYKPLTAFREHRESGSFLDESYITFRLGGGTEVEFLRLTGPHGWVLVRDPEASIEKSLRRLGEMVFYRSPGHELEAHGLFLQLLGILKGSVSVGPGLRQVRRNPDETRREDMQAVVERYVREHIDRPIEVKELARQAGLGLSSFAHVYPVSCGETPYQTVLRIRVETAKRLLLWEKMSVKETSARTGFSSPYHLSRVFRRMEGLSPKNWVRVLHEKSS